METNIDNTTAFKVFTSSHLTDHSEIEFRQTNNKYKNQGMKGNHKFDNEELFLKALLEFNFDHFSDKTWLKNNFELYKQTLNWSKGFPPIRRSNLVKGTLKEKFNSTYLEILKELESGYLLDNQTQTLVIY